ncbi:putative nucleic acid-binding protein [Mucilaginibacter gracilis]|uniref:Putative nucleic acid-binding protein n=1 Tax=Mucilaginibacter gracilis TaxID=423350 RepID=A0A495J0G2_9SPHI|nr:PIN domain-containing protein [Mucilaginibacter gracilis]RKR82202.1 putative nucleic acid-binding protein [Mucilaginibacter gracilis]
MTNVFVDTNIIIDLLADRQPFSKFAIEIFDKAEKKQVQLYTSSHSYATTHYLLKKYLPEHELRELLLSLLDMVTIIAVDVTIIKNSLQSKHKDFEDAIQIFAANTIPQMDFLVTRNLKDFKDTGVKVLPPDELLQYI